MIGTHASREKGEGVMAQIRRFECFGFRPQGFNHLTLPVAAAAAGGAEDPAPLAETALLSLSLSLYICDELGFHKD